MNPANSPMVISFGELLWDLLPSGRVLGGAPANFAFRLTSLGTPCRLISRVGCDELGSEAIGILSNLSVNTSLVEKDKSYPTGTVDVVIDSSGNASYTINRDVAYDFIEITPEIENAAKQSSLICFGSLIQRNATSRDALRQLLEIAPQAKKLVDINLRRACYSEETVRGSLDAADILKLNREEVRETASLADVDGSSNRAFCEAVLDKYNLEVCIVTRAENGCFAMSSNGEVIELPGYQVKIADTIGAGDAFTAGFVHRYLRGESLRECCDLANKLGALVATQKGAMSQFNPGAFEAFCKELG